MKHYTAHPRSRLKLRPSFLASLAVVALQVPPAAAQHVVPSSQPHLSLEVRHRLIESSGDSALAPWQRKLMLEVANGGPAGAGQGTLSSGFAPGDGTWQEVPPPPGRDGHTAIYDPVRNRMVIFGGYDGYQLLGELWALSLTGVPTWTILGASGSPPSVRYRHSAIYDPVRDRMVVFGGEDPSGLVGDLWALSLAGSPAWSALAPTGDPPSPRSGHTAIYDSVRDRMVVFGGNVGYGKVNETWALSLAGIPAWSALAPSGTPPPERDKHTAIYDPGNDRMIVFGGNDASNTACLNDVWMLTFAGGPAWGGLVPSGTAPSTRYGHTAIYDPVRNRMVVFGGFDCNLTSWNDVWTLSLGTAPAWAALTPGGTLPDARYGHTAIYDPNSDRMMVFGGRFVSDHRNDTRELLLGGAPTWDNPIPPAATPPPEPFYQAAIYDPVRERMVVFGGYDGTHDAFLNGVWTLSLSGSPVWSELVPAGASPPVRGGHTAIYDPVRDRMVVFAGRYGYGYLNDVWALSFAGTPKWTYVAAVGAYPPARWEHTAIYDPVEDRMVVFGGTNGFAYFNDVWALSLADSTWAALAPLGTPPSGRNGHTAIYDPVRGRMVVFGGTGFSYVNDTWSLALTGDLAWTALSPAGTPPAARFGHTAVYDPMRDRMVIFAGLGDAAYRDTWAMSFGATPTWSALAPIGTPPAARYGHTAIYDKPRDRMVVLGGERRHDMWDLFWGAPLSVTETLRPFDLTSVRPNPSRTRVSVEFTLGNPGRVIVEAFDLGGRRIKTIADERFTAGRQVRVWQGDDDYGRQAPVGMYFIRVTANHFRETRRAVRVR